jgi:hypothetical protein
VKAGLQALRLGSARILEHLRRSAAAYAALLISLLLTEYVTPAEREGFMRRARDEGLPELRPDLVPGGERRAYFP